jgi:hypothetical protein
MHLEQIWTGHTDGCHRVIWRKKETPPAERRWGEDQQLGRARHRERAGSTGKAGRSENGWSVAFLFLISVLCLLKRRQHCGEQTRL